MLISNINLRDDNRRIDAQIDFGSDQIQIYYQSNGSQLEPNLEAFIALSLVASMIHGEDIRADGVASQSFLDNLEAIQDFFIRWKPQYHHPAIYGIEPVLRPPSNGRRTGVFFSAGLDSFYTFLKHKDEITDLIFIHGFDI